MTLRLVDDGNTIEVEGNDVNLIDDDPRLRLGDQKRETILVDDTADDLKLQSGEDVLSLEQSREVVHAYFGPVGPRGPRGTAGEAGVAIMTRTAGEAIGAMRVVVATSDDTVVKADPDNVDHFGRTVGITTQAANEGDPIKVQSWDIIDNSGLQFTPGAWLYVGDNGALVENPPESAWWQIVGFALSETLFDVTMREPILIAEV